MTWREAVWAAVQRMAARGQTAITRSQLIADELSRIGREVNASGKTPAQTLSRVLQELRRDGLIIFDGNGRYRLARATAQTADLEAAVRTQVQQLIDARVGQSAFRRKLLAQWGACPLTGIADAPLLRASHIVPWAACEREADRLNPDNGLLLSALWDAAFDRGLVSFEDNGDVLLAARLSAAAKCALQATGTRRLDRLTQGNVECLGLHRAKSFDRAQQWRVVDK